MILRVRQEKELRFRSGKLIDRLDIACAQRRTRSVLESSSSPRHPSTLKRQRVSLEARGRATRRPRSQVDRGDNGSQRRAGHERESIDD
ncbi:hypothetical protein PYCCODRAFT_441520 [Trametes coccinea BRFM310]|uniref:Uncharacterized protein n=1 Tax=Trametes coccinea (strain BRFM310) TaxID=1353009 RepID=A0A1Y2ILV1_TRAC3|nr:hypothetical protein PYCCODRAFT_441520 [Trametes coccinea BRFM310]